MALPVFGSFFTFSRFGAFTFTFTEPPSFSIAALAEAEARSTSIESFAFSSPLVRIFTPSLVLGTTPTGFAFARTDTTADAHALLARTLVIANFVELHLTLPPLSRGALPC